MRIEKLKERLKEIDAPVSEKTLRRWGKNGLIKDHEPRPNLPGRGRGNAEEWDEQALQDAAAVWAVSNCGIMKPRALNKEISLSIKEIAHRVFTSPTVMHELPSDITITTPNPSHVYDFRSLKTKLDHNDTVNDLAVAWITAKAKVQNNEKVREEARCIKELEDAQSDEWKREKRRLKNLGAGSFPRYVFFKISDPAKVIVHWHSVLLRIKNPLLKDMHTDKFERTLEKEGVFEDVPPEEWDRKFLHIPHVFRNVPEWFQRHECRILSDSPTMKEFWDRWDRYKNSWTREELLHAINEITKDWRYLPTGWRFKFDRVELEVSSSGHDELAVFIDGNDSRKKALYAPFSEYNPYEAYDREHIGRFY